MDTEEIIAIVEAFTDEDMWIANRFSSLPRLTQMSVIADEHDADATMYRARAMFWKGKSIATQVRERIESVHSPIIGDPWNVTPDLSQTTMFAY